MTWHRLSHPSIATLFGIVQLPLTLGMVSSWCDHGTIKHYLREVNPDTDRVKLASYNPLRPLDTAITVPVVTSSGIRSILPTQLQTNRHPRGLERGEPSSSTPYHPISMPQPLVAPTTLMTKSSSLEQHLGRPERTRQNHRFRVIQGHRRFF